MITLFVHQSMNMLVNILLVLKFTLTYSHICSKLIKLNSFTDTFITVHSYDKKNLEIM